MAIKRLPEMKDFHTYPMVTIQGIQELMYCNGRYYNQSGVDVSEKVVYTYINTYKSRGTI